jgi:hypothetical protein
MRQPSVVAWTGLLAFLAAELHSSATRFQLPPRLTRSLPDAGPIGFVTLPPGNLKVYQSRQDSDMLPCIA